MIPPHNEVQNKISFQLASGCCFLTGSVKGKVSGSWENSFSVS